MAIKQRLYPTQDQETVLAMHCAHARFVWNLACEQANLFSRDKRDRGVLLPNNSERMRQLAQARAEFDWLAQGSSSVQQGALRDFDRALSLQNEKTREAVMAYTEPDVTALYDSHGHPYPA